MEENIGFISDSTVRIKANSDILGFIRENEMDINIDNGFLMKTDLKKIVDGVYKNFRGKEIKGSDLDNALKNMMDKNEKFSEEKSGKSLHELLKGCEFQLPENPVIERNPELAARIERLKLEQNERAYQAMTKSISPGKFHKEDTIGYQLNMMNRQLIAVGQVILSVAAGFAFGFLGIPLIVGGMDFGVRVLLGLFAAVTVAIAELYFLAKYMHAEDVADDLRPKKD